MPEKKSENGKIVPFPKQNRQSKIETILNKARKRTKDTSGQNNDRNSNSNPKVEMSIQGDNNTQICGDGFVMVNYGPSTRQPNISILPPRNSIGEDPLLKNRIRTLFNKIGDERKKRFGNSSYPVLYKKFKTDFKIKNNKWTVIWQWPKECAGPIIKYLERKYNNTIAGRIEKAASKENYIPARPYLYKIEKELLSHLGLKLDSKEVKESLENYFGVTSHTKLTHLDHWQFVSYLEGVVRTIENGDV